MTDIAATFSALGDSNRFAIVERLLNEGELSAGTLQESLDISAPAVSRHLSVLRKSGLLEQRIDAQRRFYSVRPEAIQTISAWTKSHKDYWQTSLDRLEKALLKEAEGR